MLLADTLKNYDSINAFMIKNQILTKHTFLIVFWLWYLFFSI